MTDQPALVTARVAITPTQAKLFAAMLEGEGIRAYVEGEGLADEVAVSRRVMNVASTHVKVRADELERAREILADVEIDDAELEAQALAAGPTEPAAAEQPAGRSTILLFVVIAIMIVILAWAIRELLAD